MRATQADYLHLLQQLLPQGSAWPRDGAATLSRLLAAMAEALARPHNRAMDMLAEADPRSALEMLPDWEKTTGLPDACTAVVTTTLQERRAAVVAKLTLRGGQARPFFTGLADALGYKMTIEEYRPFIAGTQRCGDMLNGAQSVRFYWKCHVSGPRYTPFRAGASQCGDKLGTIARAQDLECRLNKLKPAHTTVIMSYEGV